MKQREIKFRAWDKKEKKMRDDEGNFVLMQFTGLKDKNGKEIFEGDIIMGFFSENEDVPCLIEPIGTPEGSEGYLAICASPRGKHSAYALVEDTNDLKVIGNIYENKELLK